MVLRDLTGAKPLCVFDLKKPMKAVNAMKKEGHPDYHEITIIMTDGTEFKTRSTYGQAGERLQLDIDPKTHPAWTGQHRMLNRGGQLEKFNKRFAGLSGKKEGEAETAKAPLTAAEKTDKIKLTTTAKTVEKPKAEKTAEKKKKA